jgi:hypothetical protein
MLHNSQIVTPILWATVLHFCSTKTLLVNWMPWCLKFIACKLDAMMYVCLKSSDDSWSWHDSLDWLPFATSTLSTAWNLLLRGGGLYLVGVPWGFVSRCHQQDGFQMATATFPSPCGDDASATVLLQSSNIIFCMSLYIRVERGLKCALAI